MAAALIVIDMLNPYEHEDAEPLIENVRGMIDNLRELIEGARANDLRIIYVNDHHDDWSAGPAEIAKHALGGAAPELVEPILPPRELPFIVKARHSIFYQTLLDYYLRAEDISRLVFAGQVTEQCILYSALDGYLRNFEVVLATDALAHIHDDLAEAAVKMMETNLHAQLAAGTDQVLAACQA
jgi:nicotinamidase-related amidase